VKKGGYNPSIMDKVSPKIESAEGLDRCMTGKFIIIRHTPYVETLIKPFCAVLKKS
jgi:hypothetical protein